MEDRSHLFYGTLNEVQSHNLAGLLCQFPSEAANTSSKFQNCFSFIWWKQRKYLRSFFLVKFRCFGVKHHRIHTQIRNVIHPILLLNLAFFHYQTHKQKPNISPISTQCTHIYTYNILKKEFQRQKE